MWQIAMIFIDSLWQTISNTNADVLLEIPLNHNFNEFWEDYKNLEPHTYFEDYHKLNFYFIDISSRDTYTYIHKIVNGCGIFTTHFESNNTKPALQIRNHSNSVLKVWMGFVSLYEDS